METKWTNREWWLEQLEICLLISKLYKIITPNYN